MQVSDIMTEGVVSVSTDVTVTAAAKKMRDEKVGSVLVTDGDRLLGIVTDRQITHSVVADGSDPNDVLVGEDDDDRLEGGNYAGSEGWNGAVLVGEDDGQVFLFMRLGPDPATGFGPGRRLTTTEGILRVGAYAAPTVADWDGDGLEDLVVGENTGQVNLFRNLGKKGNPQFAPARILVSRVMRPRLKYGQNPKYPGGIDNVRARLEEEGHTVVQKGKRFFVENYEAALVS